MNVVVKYSVNHANEKVFHIHPQPVQDRSRQARLYGRGVCFQQGGLVDLKVLAKKEGDDCSNTRTRAELAPFQVDEALTAARELAHSVLTLAPRH